MLTILIMSLPPSVRSFCLTHRPYGGVSDDDIALLMKWVKRNCDYYYVITEKEDVSRHIHAALFCKKPKTLSNFTTDMLRLYKDITTEEKSVLRKGCKLQYNMDFINVYMAKGDDTVLIERNLPEEHTLDSYYSEIPAPKKKGPSSADPFYANLEKLWFIHKRPIEECNPSNLRNFLMKMMNEVRCIRVISDNRKIFQISCALSRYINKETSYHVEPDPFHQDV